MLKALRSLTAAGGQGGAGRHRQEQGGIQALTVGRTLRSAMHSQIRANLVPLPMRSQHRRRRVCGRHSRAGGVVKGLLTGARERGRLG